MREKKLSPFDFVGSINDTKNDVMLDEEDEKSYSPYMVNRSLSYFGDTVQYANEMNFHHHIDNRMQYDFLRLGIRKRKRFSKWFKKEKSDDVELLKDAYKYSEEKARNALKLLTSEQIDSIRARMSRGGVAR